MKKKFLVQKFESVSAFHHYLASGTIQPAFAYPASVRGGKSFCGTENYEAADDLLLNGDKETAERINANGLAELRKQIHRYAARRVVRPAVVGFAPHVPNFLAGTPNAMLAMSATRRKEKVITIVYNGIASWKETAAEIEKTAANVFAALLRIEAAGTRVNLYTCNVVWKNSQVVGAFTKIKNASKSFDVLRMVYPCVHPSYLRRHFFRYVEVTEGVGDYFTSTYGHCADDEVTRSAVAACRLDADCILSYVGCKGKNSDEIIKMIERGAK